MIEREPQGKALESKAAAVRKVIEELGIDAAVLALFDLGWLDINGQLDGDVQWVKRPQAKKAE